MTITLSIPDSARSAEQARVDQYNAGSGTEPLTIEQFAQLERDELTTQRVAAREDAIRASLASNERLMELGKAVAAQPDKFEEVEKAVQQILH